MVAPFRAAVAALAIAMPAALACSSGPEGPSGEALAAYASGMEALDRRQGRADADAAVEGFENAVELAPGYAAAWARLAQARMWLQFNHGVEGQLAEAEAAAARAVELAPDGVETHLALGYIAYWGHSDLDGALGHFDAAQALSPDDPSVAGAIGNVYRRQGRLDEAIEQYQRRVDLDPTHGQGLVTLASTLTAVGRYDGMAEAADQLLANGDGRGHVWHFWAQFNSGDTAAAWPHIPGIQEAQNRVGEPGYFVFLQAVVRRDRAAADELLEQIGTDVGAGLRNLQASYIASTGQVEQYAEAFDAWISARADALVDDPATPRERLAQAGRYSDMSLLEALRGNGDVSMQLAGQATELDPMSVDEWAGAGILGDVSSAHQALGHANPALSILGDLTERSLGPSAAWMELSPSFDTVRRNPTFQQIVEARRAMETPAP